MKKLLLILNPCSGKKKASHALADVVNVFNRGGYDVTVYITAARGDATKVVAQRAPEFYCKHNLEWFYRLIKNPSRAGRMMKLPLFLVHVAGEKRK